MVPPKVGGVKRPSLRSEAILSAHHFFISGVGPQASAAVSFCGTIGLHPGMGWVGAAASPGMSLFGTARSLTSVSGLPVSRSSTNRLPIFVVTATAGRP